MSEIIRSPILVFVISALNCAFTFLFVLSIVRTFRRYYKALVVLFSVVNATAALLIHEYAIHFFDIFILPLIVITGVMVAELMLMTKDDRYVYYLIFKLILMNYLGIFCVVSFVMRIFAEDAGRISDYMCITVVISLLVNMALYIGTKFFREVTYAYIHNKERSSLLSVYLIAGDLMLILSLFVVNPVFSNLLDHSSSEKLLYMNGALSAVFLLSVVYIIFLIYRERDEYHNNKQLENELYKAKMYRINSQRDLIASYSVNMRKAEMKDGMEFFKDELWEGTGGNYFKMLEKFSEACVHPVDRAKMAGQEAPVLANETLKKTPSFKHRLRVSPANILKCCNLNPQKREDLEATDKEWTWSEINVSLIRDSMSGEVISYITILDIDEKVESENALSLKLKVDPATGFYDGESYGDAVQLCISRVEAPGALFLIDLVSLSAAKRGRAGRSSKKEAFYGAEEKIYELHNLFRGDDILGIPDGGVVAVYTPYMADLSLLIEKSMQVINHLKSAEKIAESEISVCVGIAIYPKDGVNFNELYRHAESALYQAHIAGKNAYRFYERQE